MMQVQTIKFEPFVELSLEEQEYIAAGVNEVYLEKQIGPKGTEAQRWRLIPAGDGTYIIENIRLSREQSTPMVLDYRN